MSKAYAKQKAEEKKRSSASSASSYQQTQQKYEQQKKQAEQDARRAAENFTRASTNNQYNSNLQAYMDRLNALKSYGYDVSKPTAQIQQEMKRIQPAVQAENRYTKALQEQRELEKRKKAARNSQSWAVRVGLVDPNEAEMTFGVYDPSASERGRVSNVLAAGGKGWLAGMQNALGFALDPSQPDEAEMFFGKAPTSKLGEKISGKINEALFNQSQRLYGAADIENAASQAHLDAAKKGLGKFGQTLVDVGVAGTQMALDAGIGAATGTGMASMGTRTFGQSAREALDSGATYQQAMDYGMGSAAVELATEKMFDVAKIFGGGAFDKPIERWIVKYLQNTPVGMTVARVIAGMPGEALEEFVSSIVNPLLRSGYDPNAMQDYQSADYWADTFHEALVGGLLGATGVAGNVITGGNARMVNEVNQEALNARLQRADAFNAAQRSMFAGNTMQTGTADAEAARVLASNSGDNTALDNREAVASYAERYGRTAPAVERVFAMNAQAAPEEFQKGFEAAYYMGREGAPAAEAAQSNLTQGLTENQRQLAWEIGRDARTTGAEPVKLETLGGVETNGREVDLRNGGERDGGTNSAEQVQGLESGAGQAAGGIRVQQNAKDADLGQVKFKAEAVSPADLVGEGGSTVKNLYIPEEGSYTPKMRKAVKTAAKRGVKLHFFSGGNLEMTVDGEQVSARGMADANGNVWVRIDHDRYSADQIAQHETTHSRIRRGEVNLKAVRESMTRELGGEEAFNRALDDYKRAYDGSGLSEDAVFEEMVCDAAGGMNIFEGAGNRYADAAERAPRAQSAARKAVRETAKEGGKRAPPEKTKFSMETPVEETRTLVALHNLDEDNLRRTLKLGAFPSPSIAIVKAEQGHSKYGSITAVFPRSTIDPMADRRNRVYGGDAWTPTHRNARVEYPVDIDKAVKFEERIGELSGMTADGAFSSSSVLRAHGVDNETNMTAQEIADRLVRDDAVRAAYLAATGTAFEPEYAEKQFDRRFGNETVSKAAERIGEDRIDEIVDALNSGDNIESAVGSDMQTIRQIFLEFYADLNRSFTEKMGRKRGMSPEEIEDRIRKRAEKSLDDVSVFTYEDFVRNVYEYIHSEEKTGTEIDRLATLDKMKAAAPDADVKQWLLGEMEGLLGEPGIYNGKDYYTPSGNRRSFKQLHWEYTAENIVRAMNNASARGENYFGFGASGLHAVATTNFQNVQQMHDEENRLRAEDAETYQKKFEELDKTIQNCVAAVRRETKAHSSNSFEEQEIIGSVMMMAAQGTRTVKGVQGVFRSEGYTISDSTAKQMLLAFQEAAEIPTEYFEAKPQRVVGFDETAALIVPDNIDAALKRDAESAGMNVLTYKAGDEADRLRVVNSVEGAKFSRETDIDQLARENRALQKETDELRKAVQKWKGETKLTTRATLREQDVRKAAKQMLKDYSSKADAESVSAKLRQLGELIMNGENGEAAHWSDVRGLAEEIAEEIVNAENVNVNGDEFENFQLLTGVLKEKPIHVSEADLNDILAETGYETIGAFNRAYRGTVRITTEAAKAGDKTAQDAYYEMVEAMPGWFPEDVSEAEYVPRMLQVLEGLKPIYGTSEQTSANYEAAVTWAANDVIDRVLDESIRQNPKTFADRAQAKYDKERARLYQRIRDVRAQGNERVERTKREYTERSRKAIERMQARQEREIQKLKDRQREVRQNERERRGVTATWHKIQKLGASFRQMVEHPAQAATKHAPRELAKALQGVADVFYTENRRRSDMTVNAAIQNLIVQFDALKDTEQGIYYDPMLAELNRAAEKALLNIPANQMTSDQVNAVYRMLKAHMQNITNANKFVTGKWAKSIWETGRDWSREVDAASPVMKGWTGDFLNWQLRPDSFFKRISGFVKDSVGERVQKMFSDGTEKMLRIQQDAYYTFRKFTESKDFDKLSKRGKKDLVDVGMKDANGKPVLLTRDMMLAVYMNLRNEQNLQAATYGGIEVPNFDEYYTGKTSTSYRHRTTTANVGGDTLELRNEQHDLQKALREGELTGDAAQEAQAWLQEIEDEIQKRAEEITGQMIRVRSNIANMLTEYEKEFVDTAAAWMQKSADYLNAETMAMYGIEKAQVPNYWPLHRDLSFVNTDMRTITDEINLENVGFLKERVQSRAPIMLAGFTFELENHTKKVSQYCGFAAVQRDFNKLYNTKLTREGSSLERKIRDKFGDEQRKMGASAQQYIDAYIASVSGADKADATALSVIRRNLPRATLSLNLRVAVSQLASMPTAAAEVGWGSVVKGLPRGLKTAFSKKAKNELARKNPWFWQRYRGEGGMREFADMHEAQNWFDRFYNKAASLPVMRNLLNWCQDFDVFATASMWAMSEEWVKSNTDLQPGSEEFERAVGEKYADVIRKTQPNYTVTERSGLLRDKREGYKFLTMYKTQSNQNLNILYDANATLMKYKRDLKKGANGVTEADVKAAERQFTRAYTAVIIGGSVTLAVLRAGANAILHAMNSYLDDDDELSIESVLNGILKETVGAISGMFAFGSEIEELIMARITGDKYWGLSDSAISAVSDIVERGYKLTQGDASGEDWEKFIKSMMNVLGVPYGNAKTVVSGFVNHIKDAQNGEFLSFEAGVNRTASQETNRILNGYLNGEGDKVKRAWDELVELKGGDESKAQEAMRDGIKEAYMDGKITDKQVLDMLKRYGGKDGDDGMEYLLKWQSIQDIGVEPSKIDDAYRDGEISKKQALSALMKYKQMTQEDAQTALDKADFAEKYGFEYSEANVQQAVADGDMTPDEAMAAWKKFGNQSDAHYEKLLTQAKLIKQYPNVDPELIGTQSAKDYEDFGKAAEIPAEDFFRYWQDMYELEADKYPNGDSIPYTKMRKVAEYVSNLPISPAQKTEMYRTYFDDGKISSKGAKYITW